MKNMECEKLRRERKKERVGIENSKWRRVVASNQPSG